MRLIMINESIRRKGMEYDTMDTLDGVHAAVGGSSVLQGNNQLA